MEKRFLLRPYNALARTSFLASLALLAFLGGVLLTANPAAAQQCPTVIWADEFDGSTLDLARWSYQTGDGCTEGICGWGNNELQSYQEANVTVGGGLLTITAKKERIRGKQYTSGRIRTLGKGDWTFGRFEARLKVPQGQGYWPAFWMLSTDEVFGPWPASGEVDIMENIGSEPDKVSGTMHYGADFQNRRQSGTSFRLLNGDLFSGGFHEFAVEKEAGVIRWFVDGVLYFTQTTADIAPENWPYDERFHILLNLAVGGNFPGDPDASTVFPQALEVDYVRVYDGNRAHITGPRRVDHQATGTVYSVGNAPSGSSYTWSVPAGATLVSGQGTNTAVVDWGTTGGAVTVAVSSGCGSQPLAIDVKVDPLYAYGFSFENFDDPANVTLLQTTTGTLAEVTNPDATGINPSALSGEYTRNPTEQYDVIFYDLSAISDGSQYVTEQQRFFMDVYTSAPVGSSVLIQLEDSSLATSTNFPTGRHSRYQAFTESQNQWQRVAFLYLDSPDPGTPDGGIDNMVILFAADSFTGDSYTFDNLDSYGVSTGGSAPAAPSGLGATAVSASQIDLAWNDNANDEDGFRVERSTDGSNFTEIATTGIDGTAYSDTGLSASTTYFYRVRAFNSSGNSPYSSTANATTSGGGTATTVHVQSIVEGSQGAGQGNKNGTATVTLVDNLGNAVGSATVSGTFSGDFNESAVGVTGAGGTVTLVTSGAKKGTLTFTFCVDTVTHGTLTYDPGANGQSCS